MPQRFAMHRDDLAIREGTHGNGLGDEALYYWCVTYTGGTGSVEILWMCRYAVEVLEVSSGRCVHLFLYLLLFPFSAILYFIS